MREYIKIFAVGLVVGIFLMTIIWHIDIKTMKDAFWHCEPSVHGCGYCFKDVFGY
jgi:hypothetical protein